MPELAAASALILLCLSLFHVYWAVVGGAGRGVVPEVDGVPTLRPRPASTLAVALALAFAGLLLWETGGGGPGMVPPALARAGTWLVSAAFLARALGDFRLVGFFKRVRGSRFAMLDTFVYSPLCLAMGLASAAVALGA